MTTDTKVSREEAIDLVIQAIADEVKGNCDALKLDTLGRTLGALRIPEAR